MEDEELKRLIELAKSEDTGDELNDAEYFVLSTGLKEGNRRIPCIYIWDMYTKWCETRKRKKLCKRDFFIQFSKIFRRRHKKFRFYKLDPSFFPGLGDEYGIRLFQLQGERRRKIRAQERKRKQAEEEAAPSGVEAGASSEDET